MKINEPVACVLGIVALLGCLVLFTRGEDGEGATPPAPERRKSTLIETVAIGPEDHCADCHIPETEAWEMSHHAESFRSRHKTAEAKAILDRLGLRSMKRSDECISCHYTAVDDGRGPQARFGVSCESCHGAAASWVDVHNRPGGDPRRDALRWGDGRKESAEKKATRIHAARALGMIDSARTFDLAERCFSCHVVADGTLIEKGGHPTGQGFELLSWSQGEVRHSYLSSGKDPMDAMNVAASPEHRRRLYVLGVALEIEHTLRGLAGMGDTSTAAGSAIRQRLGEARRKAQAILERVEIAELREIVEATPVKDDPAGSSPELFARVSDAARRLAEVDGSALAAIDELLPTEVVGAVLDPEE